MGIQGLWPLLKDCIRSGHVGEFRGRRVAVDAYVWLHRAVFGCCVELAQGQPSDKWLKYCIEMIDFLLALDISVYLVFDGAPLPAKQDEERERRRRREEARSLGMSYLARKDYGNARMHLSRAIDVSPKMAAELIALCRKIRPQVRCLVAPYEADAQLAYLCSAGLVDAIITEDSDTVPYFCKEVIIKLEKNGSCQIFKLFDMLSAPLGDTSWEDDTCGQDEGDNATSASSSRNRKGSKSHPRGSGKAATPGLENSQGSTSTSTNSSANNADGSVARLSAAARSGEFRSFDRHMLVAMSIAAGCDYLPSLEGIGIKKSFKYISKHRTASRMLRALRFEGVVPTKEVDPSHYRCKDTNNDHTRSNSDSSSKLDDREISSRRGGDGTCSSGGADGDGGLAMIKRMFQYEFDFYKAFMTFFHQTVFDPIEKKLRPLHPFPENSAVARSSLWSPADGCGGGNSNGDGVMNPPASTSGWSTPVSDRGNRRASDGYTSGCLSGSESVASNNASVSSSGTSGLAALATAHPTSRRILERHIPMCMYEGWVDVGFLGPIAITDRKRNDDKFLDDSALILAVAEGRADPVTLELFNEAEFTSNILKSRASPPDEAGSTHRPSDNSSRAYGGATHGKTAHAGMPTSTAVRSAAGGVYVRTPTLAAKPQLPKDGPLHRFMHRQTSTPSPMSARQLPASAPASILPHPQHVMSNGQSSSHYQHGGAGIGFTKTTNALNGGAQMKSLNSDAPQSKSVPPRGAISRFFSHKGSTGANVKTEPMMSGNVQESLQRLAARTTARAAERIVELDSYLSISEIKSTIEVTSKLTSTGSGLGEDDGMFYSFADAEVTVQESGFSGCKSMSESKRGQIGTPNKAKTKMTTVADFSSFSNATPSDQRTGPACSNTSTDDMMSTGGPVFEGFVSDVEETFCYSVSPVKRPVALPGSNRSVDRKIRKGRDGGLSPYSAQRTSSPLPTASPGPRKRRLFPDASPPVSEGVPTDDSTAGATASQRNSAVSIGASCGVSPIKRLRSPISAHLDNHIDSSGKEERECTTTTSPAKDTRSVVGIGISEGLDFSAFADAGETRTTAVIGTAAGVSPSVSISSGKVQSNSRSCNGRKGGSNRGSSVNSAIIDGKKTTHAAASAGSKGVSPSRAIPVHPLGAPAPSPQSSVRKSAVNVIDLSGFENDPMDAFYQ